MSPKEMLGTGTAACEVSFIFGFLLPAMLSLYLLPPDHPDAYKWLRVILSLAPALIAGFNLSIMMFVFNYETPEYLVSLKKFKEAKAVLKLYYKP